MAKPTTFKGFQVLQKGMRYLYTTKEIRDYVKTQALLGVPIISIEGAVETDWDAVIDMHELGVLDLVTDYDAANMKQRIRLKLK